MPLHSSNNILGLLLITRILSDLVVEPLHYTFMILFLSSFLLARVDLGGYLHLLVVTLLRIIQITKLFTEIGEVPTLLLLMGLLLRRRQTSLVLLLSNLRLLLGLHFFDYLIDTI